MAEGYWLEQVLDIDRASHLVDASLVGCLLAAVATGWLTGLSPVVIGVILVGSILLEHGISRAARQRIVDTADATGSDPDDRLCGIATALAEKIGVPCPRVVVEESVNSGVAVLQGADGPVLLLSRPLVADLDEAALRGVIAHELAHLDGGHIRFDTREPVAHVVGATAFWVVIGQHLGPVLSLIGLGTYVGAGVFRGTAVSQLYYLCTSLGIVLIPLGLIAFAHRLQEHRADDRAVAVTAPRAFCRGLLRVAPSQHSETRPGGVLGTVPPSEQRELITRITATHPPLEQRFARYDLSIDDLRSE